MGLLLEEGVTPLLARYESFSSILGERVRIWSEEAGQDVEQLREIPPLATGKVSGFDEGLQLYLDELSEPVTRGRLVRESNCAQFVL